MVNTNRSNKQEHNYYNNELPSLSIQITRHTDSFVMETIHLNAKGYTYQEAETGLRVLIQEYKDMLKTKPS